jgi:hypothetical protein
LRLRCALWGWVWWGVWRFCCSQGLFVCRHRRIGHEDDDGLADRPWNTQERWSIWVGADGLEQKGVKGQHTARLYLLFTLKVACERWCGWKSGHPAGMSILCMCYRCLCLLVLTFCRTLSVQLGRKDASRSRFTSICHYIFIYNVPAKASKIRIES